jgi:hypothetical protein
MSTNLVRVLSASIALLTGAAALAAEPDAGATHRFKLAIASKLDVEILNQKGKVNADTEIVYLWQRDGNTRTLRVESLQVKASQDGAESMNNFMSRAKVVQSANGATEEIPFEKASDELKKTLQDSFDVPVCKIQVDEAGKEVKRNVVAGPGARSLVDNGMIANALLFHPPFHADKDEWQADAEISLGSGGFVKGKLTYKKMQGGKAGQAVKVTGTLTNDNFKLPGSPAAMKNVRYVVNGEQTYDPDQKEWIAGKLSLDVSYQMVADDKPVGMAKGTMAVTLEKLPAKK